MKKYLIFNLYILIFLSAPIYSQNKIFEIEELQILGANLKSMNYVIMALGPPDHVGLSSEGTEGIQAKENDFIVFHYERGIRLVGRGEIYRCRALVYYDKCKVKNIFLKFFGISDKDISPKDILSIFGADRQIIYKRFNNEGPESTLRDSDKQYADIESWIYHKKGV